MTICPKCKRNKGVLNDNQMTRPKEMDKYFHLGHLPLASWLTSREFLIIPALVRPPVPQLQTSSVKGLLGARYRTGTVGTKKRRATSCCSQGYLLGRQMSRGRWCHYCMTEGRCGSGQSQLSLLGHTHPFISVLECMGAICETSTT